MIGETVSLIINLVSTPVDMRYLFGTPGYLAGICECTRP